MRRDLSDQNRCCKQDWEGCIGGPEHLRSYAQLAPTALRFMDMGSYCKKTGRLSRFVAVCPANTKRTAITDAGKAAAPRQVFNSQTLAQQLPRPMLAPAVGLVEMPGHANASCGGWTNGHQCTNLSNPDCGCIDYGWTQPTLHAFLTQAEQLGVQEIDVKEKW